MPSQRYVVVPIGEATDALIANIAGLQGQGGAEVNSKWSPQLWLVAFNGTTDDLSQAIELGDDPQTGTAIVVPITNYGGYGPVKLWEWLRLHRDDS